MILISKIIILVTCMSCIFVACNPLAPNQNSFKANDYNQGINHQSVAIQNIPSYVMGGSILTLNFFIPASTTTAVLEYASDGTNFNTILHSPLPFERSFAWSVPLSNTTGSKVRLKLLTNLVESFVNSNSFSIDSLDPAAPVMALSSSAISSSRSVQLSFSSCADTSKIFISESLTAPALSTSGWVNCSTTTDVFFTLSNSDGTKNLYAFARDHAGHISAVSNSETVILDRVLDALTLTSLQGGQAVAGGTSQNITWTAADVNLAVNPIKLEVSSNAGTSWTTLSAAEANSGTYTWMTPSNNDSAQYRVRVTATDLAGNTKVVSSTANFIVDSTAPTLLPGQMSINSGATATNNNYVRVSLKAQDDLTRITQFCLKINNTAPAANDSCWRDVSANPPALIPNKTLDLVDYYFLVGFVQGFYTVNAWLKNEAGLISTLSAVSGTSGLDSAAITYNPGSPPQVLDVLATNTDAPNSPPTTAQMSITTSVIIKWKLTDADALPTNAITISYSSDDVNWTEVTTGLLNNTNGGCTVNNPGTVADDTATGCFTWNSGLPVGVFRVRVEAHNAQGMVAYASSVYLNISSFRILAGNTDTNLGASAKAAVITPPYHFAQPGSFVVLPDGRIYIRDARGLLLVSPTDGRLKLLIPTTGSSSGDGGIASSATFNNLVRITLDYANNVIIWDHNLIRKLDTSTNTISTFLGGGAQQGDNLLPNEINIEALGDTRYAVFIPMPNGDFWFNNAQYYSSVANGNCIRQYQAANGRIKKHCFQSSVGNSIYNDLGDTVRGNVDIATTFYHFFSFEFNPATSEILFAHVLLRYWDNAFVGWGSCLDAVCTPKVKLDPLTWTATTGPHPPPVSGVYGAWWGDADSAITTVGRDGKIYLIPVPTFDGYVNRNLRRFNSTTNAWDSIAGNGSEGYCRDGQVAATCPLKLQDVFVTTDQRIYLLDNGTIRLIDNDGKFVTVAGEFKSSGEAVLPTSARFSNIRQVHLWDDAGDSKVIVYDRLGCEIKEFSEGAGGLIRRIAGAGYAGDSQPGSVANGSPIYCDAGQQHAVNPTTGWIYRVLWGHHQALNRSTGLWQSLAGNGATPWYDNGADGLLGNQISYVNSISAGTILGFGNNKIITQHEYNFGPYIGRGSQMKSYAISNGTQEHVLGITPFADSTAGYFCADGTLNTACNATAGVEHYANTAYGDYNPILGEWLLGQRSTSSIFRVPDGGGVVNKMVTLPHNYLEYSVRNDGVREVVYYCATDNLLYRYDMALGYSENIAMPIASMRCAGVVWTPTQGGRLIFPYSVNGLFAVGQILEP